MYCFDDSSRNDIREYFKRKNNIIKWHTDPPSRNIRTSQRNIVIYLPKHKIYNKQF